MMKSRYGTLFRALAGLACLFAAAGWAQTYPSKPVRYLVPMSPGSGADTIGRIVAGGLAQALGQQVVVDNRTGAAGNIGADIAAGEGRMTVTGSRRSPPTSNQEQP